MADLDCETFESAMTSLCTIFRVEEEQLRGFLTSIDLEQHYRSNHPSGPADDELLRLFEQEHGQDHEQIERVYWFHLTRVHSGASFEDGLLPLGTVLCRIWEMLFTLFSGTPHESRLREMAEAGVQDFQFNLKTNDSLHWGPYAMLVRDIAFACATAHNHDYLRTPEIVEDICSGYQNQFGESIQEVVEERLVPTIVKFWSAYEGYEIESALYYVYCQVHSQKLTMSANTCFDGGGVAVPYDRIVSVQAVPYSSASGSPPSPPDPHALFATLPDTATVSFRFDFNQGDDRE